MQHLRILREPQRVMSAVRKVLSAPQKPILFWSSRFFCQLAVVLPAYSDGERSVFLRNRRQK